MGENVKRDFLLSALSVKSVEHIRMRCNFARQWVSVILFSLVFITSACTKVGSGSLNNPNGTNSSDTSTQTSDGAFHLMRVLPTQNSGTTYDMIGTNEEFDTYCNGAYGTCVCQYTYTQSGVGTQTQTGCVTYSESDLLRCTNAVPSGISTFSVQIVVQPTGSSSCTATGGTGTATSTSTGTATTTSTGYTSNSLTVNLNSGIFSGTSAYLDLTNAQSYVQAQKFQCRKNEFIADPMDPNTIDPFQSSDPHVMYAFNYYTTNVADSLLQFHNNSSNQDWECTLTATQDRSLQWWANPFVYSTASCTDAFCVGDGQQMSPQNALVSGKIPVTGLVASNGKRRSSFWLASQAYGVFQTAISAAVAPSSYTAANYAVIGYGAKPIPNVSGSSSCPNIPLPANATWVKLWNFRATDITAPAYVTASTSTTASGIACNTTSGTPVFPSCSATENNQTGHAAAPFMGDRSIASVTGTQMALRVGLLASGTVNACYNIDTTSWGLSTNNGGEGWSASPYNGWAGTPVQFEALPWNIYQQLSSSMTLTDCANTAGGEDSVHRLFKTGACPANGSTFLAIGLDIGSAAAAPSATPMDPLSALSTTQLNAGTNYTDQMFVVTDPNVSDSSMNGSTPAEYTPITYRSSSDCNGATNSACTATPIHWLINDHEVSADSSTTTVYPLCVLQFYD